MNTPEALGQTLRGYLGSSGSSIILRVRGGSHWIVVDQVMADGMFAVRDPARAVSELMTAEELHALGPTGDAVLSFPVRR